MKIGIVGPEESKWTEEQKLKAKLRIRILLQFGTLERKARFSRKFKDITLVSGGCDGIDTWAEQIADELGIKKLIFKPEVNQWPDKYIQTLPVGSTKSRFVGYRTRNIQIAKAFDIGYCIVPSDPNLYCKHHKTYGHPSNGGCWTILHGNEKLGKEVHLIVV